MLKPPRLRKGDLIGLAAPASTPQKPEKIEGAVRYLEGQGFRVRVGEHVTKVHGYLAGRDGERADDFNRMARDPEVKGIFALRGGYGTPRILPAIDYGALRRQPKVIVGYSDITALQLAIWRKIRLATFSGPMPGVEFWEKPDGFTEEHFWEMVTNPRFRSLDNPPEMEMQTARAGKALGRVMPGNLAMLVAQLGTRFLPDLRGKILVLEEIDELPYRVDRMFAQLRNGGVLEGIAGLVLGQFTRCEPRKERPSLSLQEVLEQGVAWTKGPCVAGCAYGHVPRKQTIPMGVKAELRADRGKVSFVLKESAVS